MERVDINIHNDSITIGKENKSIPISDLKKINKYLGKEYGPKTAEVVVNFLQVWNEEERDPVHTGSTNVSKRTSNTLVSRNERKKYDVRVHWRSSREAN